MWVNKQHSFTTDNVIFFSMNFTKYCLKLSIIYTPTDDIACYAENMIISKIIHSNLKIFILKCFQTNTNRSHCVIYYNYANITYVRHMRQGE